MNAAKGIVVSLLSSLLVVILFAYIFRVPIPLGGYIGPFGEFTNQNVGIGETIRMVCLAWFFTGYLAVL